MDGQTGDQHVDPPFGETEGHPEHESQREELHGQGRDHVSQRRLGALQELGTAVRGIGQIGSGLRQ